MAKRTLSRRAILKMAGAAPVSAAAVSAIVPAVEASPDTSQALSRTRVSPRPRREPLRALTTMEADVLEAIADRLIPADASGPGAVDAQAVRYIDRALAGALSEQRDAYRVGVAALDRYATVSRGRPFLKLSPTEQDSLLIDVETGTATGANVGFQGSSAAFFTMVRGHVWQGTFGDPYYGGNTNFVGWDLIGYPGVRTYVAPAEQRLDSPPTRVRKSAYDEAMFEKAVVDARTSERARDAD